MGDLMSMDPVDDLQQLHGLQTIANPPAPQNLPTPVPVPGKTNVANKAVPSKNEVSFDGIFTEGANEVRPTGTTRQDSSSSSKDDIMALYDSSNHSSCFGSGAFAAQPQSYPQMPSQAFNPHPHSYNSHLGGYPQQQQQQPMHMPMQGGYQGYQSGGSYQLGGGYQSATTTTTTNGLYHPVKPSGSNVSNSAQVNGNGSQPGQSVFPNYNTF